MRRRRRGILKLLLAAVIACAAAPADAGPVPVSDPVPTIERGDIVVGVRTIAQLPRLDDAPNTVDGVEAHARIQNLVPAPDGSADLFVNDLRGVIYRIQRDEPAEQAEPTPYLDLRGANIGFTNAFNGMACGLSGFAFHPDFTRVGRPGHGKLYVLYSAPPGSGQCDHIGDGNDNHESVLLEWTTGDPHARSFSGTWREVLRVGQPGKAHNAGTIAFNPTVGTEDPDYGLLYISFGDGTGQHDPTRAGQRRDDPHGSLLRINPLKGPAGERHTIPRDNPFVDEPNAAPLVWVYGLRHPQHFSWDGGGSHRMFLIDMGQNQVEELNVGVRGGNYGWPDCEGTFATGMAVNAEEGPVYPRASAPADVLDPVAQYDHGEGKVISSVVVYRGRAIPELFGKVVCGDIVNGRIFYVDEHDLQLGRQAPLRSLRLKIDGEERPLRDVARAGERVDLRLGLDGRGELYLLTKSDGKIRQVVPAASPRIGYDPIHDRRDD